MLSVNGILYISPKVPVVEQDGKNGAKYFHFLGIGKNPYAQGTKQYKVSVYVNQNELEDARKGLQSEKTVWLRQGELDSYQMENAEGLKGIYATVTSRWQWIEPLTKTLSKERK